MTARWIALCALVACSGSTPAPEPEPKPAPAPPAAPKEVAPEVAFAPCSDVRTSPAAAPADAGLTAARAALMAVVEAHTGDPENPWAIVHGMLARGPEMKLDDGKAALPWLFEGYAERREVGGVSLIAFPGKRASRTGGPEIRVEPHTDLILKALTEARVPMDSTFIVQGEPATVADLYRGSLHRTWVDGAQHSFRSLNDSPWTLQALTAVAPAGLTWVGEGGHSTSLDAVTNLVVGDLAAQNAFLRDAMAAGGTVKKERQGIFAYACGGQHLLQGSAHAVARGFGSPASRAAVEAEVPVLYWRMGVELGIYDGMIAGNPEYAVLLLEQRLKFLGHFLETAHKLAALGIYTPSADQSAQLMSARVELARTVADLQARGAFDALGTYRADPKTYQMYLDFVGDASHAVRGIDLATGAGTVCL